MSLKTIFPKNAIHNVGVETRFHALVAQSVARETLNLKAVGSSPTQGEDIFLFVNCTFFRKFSPFPVFFRSRRKMTMRHRHVLMRHAH